MATKTRIVGWNPKALLKEMTDNAIALQTERLVEYAKGHILLLGETISAYNSANSMDRTGNLLDSLCWGVTYNGKYVDNGFYRNQTATMSSGMHEWWKGGQVTKWKKGNAVGWESVGAEHLPEVWGHDMAEKFLERQEKEGQSGWRVFFAILAPYWGYWEKGFNMKGSGGWNGRFLQFAVMTQFHDQVKQSLKPAKVTFRVTSAIKYSNTGLMKKAKRGLYSNKRIKL